MERERKVEQQDIYLDIDEQIEKLRADGLEISDYQKAKLILQENNYTSIIRYYGKFFLDDPEKENSRYREGTQLEHIHSLLLFNHQTSSLCLEYIFIVERKIRAIVSDVFASEYSPIAYWKKESYSDKGKDVTRRVNDLLTKLKDIVEELCKNKAKDSSSPFFRHINKNPKEIPIWLFINAFSFGTLRQFYTCQKHTVKQKICKKLMLQPIEMETALANLNDFRNICAHNERVYDYYNKRAFIVLNDNSSKNKNSYDGVYAITKILKMLLPSTVFIDFYTRLNELFVALENAIGDIDADEVKEKMRFPLDETILLNELGAFDSGVILSRQEFVYIISKYILPLIPRGTLDTQSSVEEWIQKRNVLVEYNTDEKRLYFSQAKNANFMLRTLPLESCSDSIIKNATIHLRALISNLQVVWNTKNAKHLRDKERLALFESNSEIAFQLSLCEILCLKETPGLQKKYGKERQELRDELSRIVSSNKVEKNRIKKELRELKDNFLLNPIIRQERNQRETLYGVLSIFDKWAQRTYEGNHVPFGIIIGNKDNITSSVDSSFDYIEFLKENYSATISDGKYSYVEIFADGFFSIHGACKPVEKKVTFVPYPYHNFSLLCESGKVGVILNKNDITIITNERIAYSKRSGRWSYSLFDNAIDIIEKQLKATSKDKRRIAADAIFQTLIDVSYSQGGACLAISNNPIPDSGLLRMAYPMLLWEEDRKIVEESASDNPLTEEEKMRDEKRLAALRNLIGKECFQNLNEFLRRELIEMDGATILSADGKVRAVAAIVNTNGASVFSGARTTAAVRLSQYGLAVKVSQDGDITFYNKGVDILKV